jgi:diacylglycerol kinase (ATP)
MSSDDSAQPPSGQGPSSPFKSTSGWRRVLAAAGYSWAGLKAAVRHEAAFRQELALGIPLLALAWWLAPGRWQALALTASVVLVWIVELLNSSIEALADTVSREAHPLIGRAKDLGSAAVMGSLLLCGLTWAVVFWPA